MPFGRSGNRDRPSPSTPGVLSPWEALRCDTLPVAVARQRRLEEAGTADGPWTLDLDEGTATVGGTPTRVGVLGNSSDSSGSFMFGWRLVEANGLDPDLGLLATAARDRAAAYGPTPFDLDAVDHGTADPDELALVCSVLAGPAPMYRGGHDGGAIYFALLDVVVDEPLPSPAVVTGLAGLASLGLPDHGRAARAMLASEGFATDADETRIVGTRGHDVVTVTLDADGRRIGHVGASLRPA